VQIFKIQHFCWVLLSLAVLDPMPMYTNKEYFKVFITCILFVVTE